MKRDVAEGKVKNLDHFGRASDAILAKTRTVDPDGDLLCAGGECSLIVGDSGAI